MRSPSDLIVARARALTRDLLRTFLHAAVWRTVRALPWPILGALAALVFGALVWLGP